MTCWVINPEKQTVNSLITIIAFSWAIIMIILDSIASWLLTLIRVKEWGAAWEEEVGVEEAAVVLPEDNACEK